MKKGASFLITLFIVLLRVLLTFNGAAGAESADVPAVSSDLPVFGGEALDDLMKSLIKMKTFDAESYGLEGNYEIIEEISGKLEASRGADRIRLVALRREGGVYNRGFLLEVIPSGEAPFVVPVSGDVRGFEASIASKNFMSREKSEILLTVDGGRRGDRFLVIAVAGGQGEVVLDTYAVKIPAVAGRFFDDYRAEVVIPETGEITMIDLSPRKDIYDRRSVYSETGKLRRRVTVLVDKISRFEPVDLDHDGILEIKEVMDLNGIDRADRIAYVDASLKYAGGVWNVMDSWIAPAEDLDKMPLPRIINLEE